MFSVGCSKEKTEDTAVPVTAANVQKATGRRLRPIVMTALATLAGMLPLSFAIGAGSQMLQPLAIAVIGGVVISMVLSLIITPAVHFFAGAEPEKEMPQPSEPAAA
jgi:multidrug efflux pump subunit AcrB